ncbi:MAG: hypothetical protein C0623_06870 [Desulfuromonas sp.]|nr:MAG: hypothetical protein C0623_06870 [Desulfuromonas sp.]
MGLFSKLGGKDYPALSSDSAAAEQLANMQAGLKDLIEEIPDKLEVIPGNDSAYVFIGKPPKKFGVAWVDDEGHVGKLHTLVAEQGVQPAVVQGISEELRVAYEKNQAAERFKTDIEGKEVVVTPCAELRNDVAEIIGKVLN